MLKSPQEVENWLERLMEIAADIQRPRGSFDAPSRYSLAYLFGYISSAKSIIVSLRAELTKLENIK